jgi:hypothetical protein
MRYKNMALKVVTQGEAPQRMLCFELLLGFLSIY